MKQVREKEREAVDMWKNCNSVLSQHTGNQMYARECVPEMVEAHDGGGGVLKCMVKKRESKIQ